MPVRNRAVEGPEPVDIDVGARMRERRRALGLSQGDLAKAMGITFQQVQKYERGYNRVSASRLVQAARVLKTSAAWLIGEEMGALKADLLRQLTTIGALRLLAAYEAIPSPEARASLVELAAAQAYGDYDVEQLSAEAESRVIVELTPAKSELPPSRQQAKPAPQPEPEPEADIFPLENGVLKVTRQPAPRGAYERRELGR
jgi:transcriptional regulator with XRE-family HTH domain